jgi:TolA-binding protein
MIRRVAPLAASMLLSACVMTKEEGDTLKRDVDKLKTEVSAMHRQQKDDAADLEARLARIESRAAELEGTLLTLRQADADNGVQMEKVIAELQILRGEIEEARFALQETKSQLGETKRSVQDILARPPIDVAAAASAPVVDTQKGRQIGGETVPEGKQELYDFAKKLHDAGKHDDAIEAFTLFVEKHKSDTDLKDNAFFWLGESHYQRATKESDQKSKDSAFKKAILAYQKVIETEGSNKADGALMKLGLAFEAVNYGEDGRVFYEELIAKYPKSPLVVDAKKRLVALDKAKSTKKPKKK